MVNLDNIKVGDRIKVSTWHRGGTVKGVRVVTGITDELTGKRHISIRCNGFRNFYLKDEEVLEHYPKQQERFCIRLSSIFDNPSNHYDIEGYKRVLKDAGMTDIHTENNYGWSNQPEVVIFSGDTLKAEMALMDSYPLFAKWGVMIDEVDW